MTAMRTSKPSLDQRSLATQAMQTAAATRAEAGVGQAGPICIYAVCETLGVTVRFNNINMEGMYQRGAQPRIHLSARRPLPRRAFNCAHELGHHKFRHGTSIDELREDAKSNPWEDSKEFLADTFAGFMLMPTIGLRRAFQARGWAPATATPAQMFTIACEFGVGYNTILTHLSASMNMLPYGRAKILNALHPAGPLEDHTDRRSTETADEDVHGEASKRRGRSPVPWRLFRRRQGRPARQSLPVRLRRCQLAIVELGRSHGPCSSPEVPASVNVGLVKPGR